MIIKDLAPEDLEYMKDIKHPVHVTVADGDNILRNEDIKKFYETIATPADRKEIQHFDSDHYILSDGWLYEDVIEKQLAWLDKIYPATATQWGLSIWLTDGIGVVVVRVNN